MKESTIYTCDYCGLQGDKNNIKKHEAICVKNTKQVLKETIQQRANNLRLNAETPKHFAKLIEEYILSITGKVVNITFDQLHLQGCSNTWRCPIDGTTNFERKSPRPMSYVGLSGNFIYEVLNICNESPGLNLGQDLFNKYGEIPGLHFDEFYAHSSYKSILKVTLFIDDFPKIKKKYDELVLIEANMRNKDIEIADKKEQYDGILKYAINTDPTNKVFKEQINVLNELINSRNAVIKNNIAEEYGHLLKNNDNLYTDHYKKLFNEITVG